MRHALRLLGYGNVAVDDLQCWIMALGRSMLRIFETMSRRHATLDRA